ncbi:Wadjet anti-phage system protein JetD domain-containing protein [Dokdonella fugitiva]|uniref:Uncharacterized protein DUF2220 n=1 Tax=Dokdonella fugitiva TaxID=328517 RepID=A0A4R2I6H3_9GAMM|nr:Wadjet anti-phage system protein JetD domain-containing protein [Dokdonella fugitiva]MBA8884294.1 hypothetical protein [Dokdonella fugitiva]TCO39901.1 uncharacterized protein DUF2220 [Dokdonella fugitiva]
MNPAAPVLARLLGRAERARLRGDAAPAALSMASARDAREYAALQSLREIEAFHAAIALAERDGAIVAERDRHRGDGETLLRLVVADVDALARHLGVDTVAQRSARAAATLAPWTARFPVIAEILALWRRDATLRKQGPEAAHDLAAAAFAVDALLADPEAARGERTLRRESVRLFGDSKRIEALTPWLDILLNGEPASSGLDKEQVWAALGLRKEPLPLLLAGVGLVELDDGSRVALPRRYLGLPAESVRAIDTPARHVLSIENAASFHDAARARGDAPVLLLYAGGMPSPTWRAAYRRLLGGLCADAAVYHWGDIDEGGMRIAAKIAETARDAGFDLRPWLMSPGDIPAAIRRHARTPTPAVLASMRRWATRAGWPGVADAIGREPILLEQEAVDPVLPR